MSPASCCLALGAEGFSRSFSISNSPPWFVFVQLAVHTALGAVLEVEDALKVWSPQPDLASTGLWGHTKREQRGMWQLGQQ